MYRQYSASICWPNVVTAVLFLTLAIQTAGVSAADDLRSLPATPGAEDCVIAPRSVAEIVALVEADAPPATPIDQLARPTPETSEISDLIWEMVACTNANSSLQWLALFTSDYISWRFGPEFPDDLGSLIASSSRTPAPASPGDRLDLVKVVTSETSSGGPIEVTVITSNNAFQFEDVLIVVWDGDQWRVNSVLSTRLIERAPHDQ